VSVRTRDPDVLVNDVERVVGKLGVGVIRGFVRAVRERNPYDTGWSQANWLASIGSPTSRLNGFRAPGGYDNSLPEALLDDLEGWTPRKGNIYVTNNVPYVPKLNATHPGAAGYVPVSVIVGIQTGITGSFL
jgi:hypothetical protein